MAAEATSVCPSIIDSGPRCGTFTDCDFDLFLRLFAAVDAEGSSVEGASGAADAEVAQIPIMESLDADKILEVELETSTLSTLDL